MNDRDTWTCIAMEKFGGGFVKALAALARHADANNLSLIKANWPRYWSEYEAVGKELEGNPSVA